MALQSLNLARRSRSHLSGVLFIISLGLDHQQFHQPRELGEEIASWKIHNGAYHTTFTNTAATPKVFYRACYDPAARTCPAP